MIPGWSLPAVWLLAGLLLFGASWRVYRRWPASVRRFERMLTCGVLGSLCVSMGTLQVAGELATGYDPKSVVRLQIIGLGSVMLGMLLSPLLFRWAVGWYRRSAEDAEFAEDAAGNSRRGDDEEPDLDRRR